jgi:hypothetical protein
VVAAISGPEEATEKFGRPETGQDIVTFHHEDPRDESVRRFVANVSSIAGPKAVRLS